MAPLHDLPLCGWLVRIPKWFHFGIIPSQHHSSLWNIQEGRNFTNWLQMLVSDCISMLELGELSEWPILSLPFINTDLMVGAWLDTPVATGLKISWLWLRSNNVLILVKTFSLSCFFMTLTLYQEIKLLYIYYKNQSSKFMWLFWIIFGTFDGNHCFYYIYFVRLLLFEVAGVYKWSAAEVQSK